MLESVILGALKRTLTAEFAGYFAVALLLALVSGLGLEDALPGWAVLTLFVVVTIWFYRRFFLPRKRTERQE